MSDNHKEALIPYGQPGSDAGKCILFPMGIKGHLFQINAFRQEFKIPVVGVTLLQQYDLLLEEYPEHKPDRVYSFPQYYLRNIGNAERLSNDEVRSKIKKHEKKWNIPSSATWFYMDRYNRMETNYNVAIRNILLYLDFVQILLSRETPLWIKSNKTTFFGLVLQQACLSMNIPCLKPSSSRLSGRIEFSDEVVNGGLRGWKKVYSDLHNDPNAVSQETRKSAEEWLDNFLKKPERPKYAIQNSVVDFDIRRIMLNFWRGIAPKFTKSYWDEIVKCPVDRKLHNRAHFGHAFFKDFLHREIRNVFYHYAKWYKTKPDMSEPYIYLPLQYSPEMSTLTYGLLFEDQKVFVENLAKYIPSCYRIYVKEHTSMMGRRPPLFYKELAAYHNVTVIGPQVNTFDLIRNAKAIATISSTVGWEAFLMGKPVLAFGDVSYNEFPNVLHLDINKDMTSKIQKYIETFIPEKESIKLAVIAYFSVTYPVTTGDIGVEISAEQANSNAEKLAKSFHDQLNRFPLCSSNSNSVNPKLLHEGT